MRCKSVKNICMSDQKMQLEFNIFLLGIWLGPNEKCVKSEEKKNPIAQKIEGSLYHDKLKGP